MDGITLNGIAIDWYVKRNGDLFCPVCSTERANRGCVLANFSLDLASECACCGLSVGESEGLVELRKENA